MRRWVMAVSVLLLAAGCAGVGAAGGSPGNYQSADVQQQGSCDSVPAPATVSLIGASVTVTAAAVCSIEQQYVAHQGSWNFMVVRTVPTDKIPALVAALRLPDASGTAGACDASLITVPDFVLTLSDSSRIRLGLPGDGCHPRREAMAALAAATIEKSRTRGTQVRTESEITTNCGDGAKSPAIWQQSVSGGDPNTSAGAKDSGGAKVPTLPRTGSISVCRYRGTADQTGTLVATGLHPAAVVAARWPTASQIGPQHCATAGDVMSTPAVDWLMMQRAPQPPYVIDDPGSGLIAVLELGGCARLVDPVHGLVGSVDPSVIHRLAELADRPVG